jgi:hypothetical protein
MEEGGASVDQEKKEKKGMCIPFLVSNFSLQVVVLYHAQCTHTSTHISLKREHI